MVRCVDGWSGIGAIMRTPGMPGASNTAPESPAACGGDGGETCNCASIKDAESGASVLVEGLEPSAERARTIETEGAVAMASANSGSMRLMAVGKLRRKSIIVVLF